MPMPRTTHTYVILDVAPATFKDLQARLLNAGVIGDYAEPCNEAVAALDAVGFVGAAIEVRAIARGVRARFDDADKEAAGK